MSQAEPDGGAWELVRDELHFRDQSGAPSVFALDPARPRLLIGRSPQCDLVIDWDPTVSRGHALLERVGEGWFVVDSGLSANGTFVAGERLAGGRRLVDGTTVRVGGTVLTYRSAAPTVSATVRGQEPVRLTEKEREVLRELCRPMLADPTAAPASNEQIAAAVFLSRDRVKDLLGSLFDKLGVGAALPGQKRTRLARTARETGLV